MPSKVVSLRLKEREAAYLDQQARMMQRSLGETAALFLAEKLKEEQFPHIEFRSTVRGRMAYVARSRLAVWQVIMHARDRDFNAARIAKALDFPVEQIQAALDYYAAYPDEVDAALEYVDGMTVEKLRQILPNVQEVRVSELRG